MFFSLSLFSVFGPLFPLHTLTNVLIHFSSFSLGFFNILVFDGYNSFVEFDEIGCDTHWHRGALWDGGCFGFDAQLLSYGLILHEGILIGVSVLQKVSIQGNAL